MTEPSLCVLVTGADHVWGQLAAEAVAEHELTDRRGRKRRVGRIVLPVHDKPWSEVRDPMYEPVRVSITDQSAITQLVRKTHVESVIHFETVTADRDGGDEDIARTVTTNVGGSLNILEALRQWTPGARLVFCSSLAVFEGSPGRDVDETMRRRPETLYGATKAAVELLVDAYAARGAVDARSAILPMCVSWRAEARNRDFLHDVIGEVVDREEVELEIEPDRRLYFNGYETCIANLLEIHELPTDALKRNRGVIEPGVAATVEAVVDALREAAGRRGRHVGPVRWRPDPDRAVRLDRFLVDVDDGKGRALGLSAPSLDAIATRYIADLDRIPDRASTAID